MINVGASTLMYFKEPLDRAVIKLLQQGFKYIELFWDGPVFDINKVDVSLLEKLKKIKAENKLTYFLHSPCYDLNLSSLNKSARNEAINQVVQSIEVANFLSIKDMVIHLGEKSDFKVAKEYYQGIYFDSLKKIMKKANEKQINICIENTGYGSKLIVDSAEEHLGLIECLPYKNLFITFDVGHTVLQNFGIEKSLLVYENKLRHIHLHDNEKDKDTHLSLGEGKIELEFLLNNLKKMDGEINLILEIYSSNNKEEKFKESLEFVKRFSL